MDATGNVPRNSGVKPFDCDFVSGHGKYTYMGSGSLGAKALGLARVALALENKVAPLFRPAIEIDIPQLTVIATDFFDSFVNQGNLLDMVHATASDEQIAMAFHRAELPAELVRNLRAFLTQIRVPLAIRSSSLLEDAMGEPFAGIYATAMVPNHGPDLEGRLVSLMEAVKYLYASTFFKQARDYRHAVGRTTQDEKMAVIIQEVVGTRHDGRFYPHISGVARSFNFYPLGLARPEDGVIDLALGLGKMIVENGTSWPYSPAYPHANPPYTTVGDLLKWSQKDFWAISLTGSHADRQPPFSPYLGRYPLSEAERDGTLSFVASTYDGENDRILMGTGRPGPRIVDFAHIVKGEMIPLTPLLRLLLTECTELLGAMVSLEFAVTWSDDRPPPARFGFLQVRPMLVSKANVHIRTEQMEGDRVLAASESALGNGKRDDIHDIVYLKVGSFDVSHTPMMAAELEEINRKLLDQGRPYLLIGFGRWGTTDPSAGIPVSFAQISGARIIVETTLPDMDILLSHGSHFFHNVIGFNILYFSVSPTGKHAVDWTWLNSQTAVAETSYVRHVRTARPLQVEVDGITSRGVIYKQRGE